MPMDMSGIDRITDLTLRGLNIGVLAGVSGGIMKNIDKMFTQPRTCRRRKRKR